MFRTKDRLLSEEESFTGFPFTPNREKNPPFASQRQLSSSRDTHKSFTAFDPHAEAANVQFRAEAFNALNKTNLGTPDRFVNTPQFGTITMAMTPECEIQLSARVSLAVLAPEQPAVRPADSL